MMVCAYKQADGQKLDNKRVLVDVEQGRTVPNWRPCRLGGGLGSTRIGGEDLNQKYSGRKPQQIASVHAYSEEPRSREDRHAEREKSRERGRDRDREHEKSRERARDKMHDSDPREDRHHKDHDRSRDREMERGRGRDHGWNRAGIMMWTVVVITTGNVDGIAIVKGIGTMIVMTMSGVVPVIGTMMLSQNRNRIGLATGRGSMMTLSPYMMENDMGTLSLKTNLKVMIIMSVIAMDNWIPMMNKSGMKEWSPMTIRTDLIVMTQRHKKGRRVEIGNESISHSDLKVLLESWVF